MGNGREEQLHFGCPEFDVGWSQLRLSDFLLGRRLPASGRSGQSFVSDYGSLEGCQIVFPPSPSLWLEAL